HRVLAPVLVGERLAREDVDRDALVGPAQLGEQEPDLVAVGRSRVVVQLHRRLQRRRGLLCEIYAFSNFRTAGHDRVFSTWSFVSQARRACATPSSAHARARSSCASVETTTLAPASPASRAWTSRRSSRFGCELISRTVPVAAAFSTTRSTSIGIGPRMFSFRPVRWPMQSTFGFSSAPSTRSVGLRSKPAWIDAITQSSLAGDCSS